MSSILDKLESEAKLKNIGEVIRKVLVDEMVFAVYGVLIRVKENEIKQSQNQR